MSIFNCHFSRMHGEILGKKVTTKILTHEIRISSAYEEYVI